MPFATVCQENILMFSGFYDMIQGWGELFYLVKTCHRDKIKQIFTEVVRNPKLHVTGETVFCSLHLNSNPPSRQVS